MFYLVKYLEDGILQVVPKVVQRGSTTRAKYYGKYYDAQIIAKNTSSHVLENILINIELHLPIVFLERIDYMTFNAHEDKDPESQISDFTGILTEPMNLPKYEKLYINDNSGLEILQDTVYDKKLTMYNEEKDPVFNMSVSPGILVEALNHPIIIPEDGKFNMFHHSGSEISQDTIYESTGTHVKKNELIYTVGSSPSIIIQSNEILVAKNTPNLQIICEGVQESSQLISKSLNSPYMENESRCGILNDIDTIQNDKCYDEENNKKTTQKKHCCFYCQKVLFKIYRHYTTVHKTEKEVRDILVLPAKSGPRKLLLDNLRKKGDYFFNTTLKNVDQFEILCRDTLRNGRETMRTKNVPCPQCLGYYSKLSIRHHVKKCFPTRTCKKRLNIQAECRKLLNNIHEKASEDLKTKIFPFFNDDEVSNILRYDEAIITYGNYMCRKHTTEHHAPQIRSNLRSFGRLLLAIREINPNIKELSEVLDPMYVELIINAIDKVAMLDENSHLYKSPATALLLATELKRLCKLLIMEYARKRDKEGQKRMEDLLLTFNLEFQITVNKRGLDTQKINSRRKKTILPTTEHIAEFRIYLEGRIRYFINKLERCYSQKDWMNLAEYTLVHLAVFNRKRPGETQRILIDDYKNFEILNENDMSVNTDALSNEQIKKWARIRLTGKLGKNTALLVHRELGFRAINLILKYREKAGVDPVNRYLFGVPSNTLTQNTFQACQLIRKFSYESEIENPELLRTRLLRQHLATKTAESHVDQRLEGRVSDFMSHKRHIHEDYYVMTQKTDDITKVSKLLENFSSVHNNKHDSQKSKTSSHLKDLDRVSSNEEYFPDKNNNKRTRKSLSHERCLKDESDEEYMPDVNNSSVTQAELDSILGKRQTRRSWNSFEKSLAREFFQDEIINGTIIERAKVNEFFELNKELYKNRTPHLIMQWIKCQRNAVLAEKAGKKGKRIRWSTPEKEVLRNSTERHSSEGTNPTLPECELILEQNIQVLKYRNPRSIKSFICTELTKREMD